MWRPRDEFEACAESTAVLEYLRATRGPPDLAPPDLLRIQRDQPVEYAAILADIRGNQAEIGASADASAPGTSHDGQGRPNR
jgi:glutathione S-transferase